ncbi:hypothetical protein WJX77_012198 [Trebouxia sp. C0004]
MPTCVTCILQILTVAHSLGYINRDVRPDNMLVDGDSGVIYLVDWGNACTAFSLCHPAWQAQLCGISKLQAKEWWRHTVWQQRSCWQEAGQNDYEGIALRLQKLM